MRIAIVDTIIEKDNKILMIRRAFYPEGKLDTPGGFVDAGENIEDAAVREVKEETGFDVQLVKKLGEYDYTDRGEKTAHGFIEKIISGSIQESKEGCHYGCQLKK